MKKHSLLLPAVLGMVVLYPAFTAPITAVDADNKERTLNEVGRISAIISSNQDIQKQTRETGQLLDRFQGQPDFREMVVVDLRNSLGNMVPSFVRMEMRGNLDKEARRIVPFFLVNGNKENPRAYTVAIPDFDGKLCQTLGWDKTEPTVRVVIFDRNGQVAFRWAPPEEVAVLQNKVRDLLK